MHYPVKLVSKKFKNFLARSSRVKVPEGRKLLLRQKCFHLRTDGEQQREFNRLKWFKDENILIWELKYPNDTGNEIESRRKRAGNAPEICRKCKKCAFWSSLFIWLCFQWLLSSRLRIQDSFVCYTSLDIGKILHQTESGIKNNNCANCLLEHFEWL